MYCVFSTKSELSKLTWQAFCYCSVNLSFLIVGIVSGATFKGYECLDLCLLLLYLFLLVRYG